MALVVQKYGGTSVANPGLLKTVARRVSKRRAAGDSLVIVLSAAAGETDRLLGLAHEVSGSPDARELDVLLATGEQASVAACKVPIQDDRLATGKAVAAAVKDVPDLNLVMALGEMRLSFETKEGVSVEDFIKGVLADCPEGTTLFGGNSMPDKMPAELHGKQFFTGEALKGHVVALGLGGPIASFGNHANEFTKSAETAEVTEIKGKWNKVCSECGYINHERHRYCESCGCDMTEREVRHVDHICPKCRTKVAKHVHECCECGARFWSPIIVTRSPEGEGLEGKG